MKFIVMGLIREAHHSCGSNIGPEQPEIDHRDMIVKSGLKK
jgi:hypothetical protein